MYDCGVKVMYMYWIFGDVVVKIICFIMDIFWFDFVIGYL